MRSSQNNVPAKVSALPVAVDAMGGDFGHMVQIEGAILAYREFGARTILIGKEEELRAGIDSLGANDLPLVIRNAGDVITMSDAPARAVRRKPDSSLCVACRMLQEGDASAMLSAGNTGAMMAAGALICGLLPGIERPAIATLIPVAGNSNPNVMLDTGANVDCHAQNLVQFAVMGSIYYTSLFDEENPRVGLLSNGSEASKGTDVIRAASLILSQLPGINYVGYVEGRDVTSDVVDIIVCDGFVGNVLLKASEGVVRLIYKQLLHEGRKGVLRKVGLGLSKGAFREVFAQKFDYTAHGGAPLLGLNKLAVVLHGSSDARAVKNAIRLADSFAVHGMTEKISLALSQLDEALTPSIDSDILSGVFSQRGNNNEKGQVSAGEGASGETEGRERRSRDK